MATRQFQKEVFFIETGLLLVSSETSSSFRWKLCHLRVFFCSPLRAPFSSQHLKSLSSIDIRQRPSASEPGALSQSPLNGTSSPASKSHPHQPSIFILPLSWLIDFLFSLSFPSLFARSALPVFSNTYYSSAFLSIFFFIPYFLLPLSLLDLVRVSPLWQGRSPSRARSCLRSVNGDVM